jgi:hypothetical protein
MMEKPTSSLESETPKWADKLDFWLSSLLGAVSVVSYNYLVTVLPRPAAAGVALLFVQLLTLFSPAQRRAYGSLAQWARITLFAVGGTTLGVYLFGKAS